MKSIKKITALLIAFILTFSVLGLISSAVDVVIDDNETVPTLSADELEYKPTYAPTAPTSSDKSLEEDLKDFIDDEFGDKLEGIGEDIKDEVSTSYGLMNFFRKAFRAFIELFEHIADLLYPSNK